MLLSAAGSAYAGGPVTLKDGSTMTWQEFVNAVNNPSSVKGTVPENDPTRVALKSAQDKVKLVQDSLKLEQDTVANLKDVVAQKKQALQGYIDDTVTPKKNAYDNAEATLASWNSQMSEYNNTLTNLTAQSQELSAQLDDAKEELSKAQSEYAAVGTTTTKTITTIDPWLDGIYSKAQAYQTAWTAYLKKNSNNASIPIYYILQPLKRGKFGLYLSFDETTEVPEVADTDKWLSVSDMKAFEAVLYPESAGDAGLNISVVEVYLGKNQEGKYNYGDNGLLSVNSAFKDNEGIISAVVSELKSLTQTPGYFTTTTETETTYNDPDGKLKKAVDDAQDEVDRLRNERSEVTSDLSSTRSLMTSTQNKIDGYTKVPAGSPEGTLSEQARLKKEWQDAVDGEASYQDAIDNAENDLNDAQEDVTAYQEKVTAAQQEVKDAEADLKTAQAAADSNAFNNYKSIQLTNNIEVTSSITENFDGTINGNNNVITVKGVASVFNDRFYGHLYNAAINGKFAQSINGASFDNVAVNAGNNSFRFYDEDGKLNNDIKSLGQLGFIARSLFGVNDNFTALVTLDDYTKVYSVSVYNGPNNTAQQNYVTCNKDKEMFGKDGQVTIPVNNFAKSATDDIASLKIPNVYYVVDGNNECANVVIEGEKVGEGDDKAYKSFYCPEDIKATSLTLNRSLKAGMNSVCLPFVLNRAYGGINAVCTYNQETKDGFVFTFIEGNVPANTPVLLFADNAISEISLSDIQINATDASQITKPTVSKTGKSACYGTFKSVLAGEFEGQTSAESVYGLNAGKFQKAGASATFAPFRVAIVNYAESASVAAAPRRIIIKNEDGDDITDLIIDEDLEISGVADIEEEALAFNVSGGQGEIVITSDADYGKVVVYTMDGKAVESANVVAGTTTVNVQKGLYIVMGKKVMVK